MGKFVVKRLYTTAYNDIYTVKSSRRYKVLNYLELVTYSDYYSSTKDLNSVKTMSSMDYAFGYAPFATNVNFWIKELATALLWIELIWVFFTQKIDDEESE